MGLGPMLVDDVFRIIGELSDEGKTILLIEQNAMEALNHSHRGYVLRAGEIVMEGRSADLAADPGLRKAFLGV